ncbi:ribonuclease H-like domain-containing protein [Mesobacillus jeotgali]|uniref:ribonuclease H-like domain-containing protein n=1 Tax=Mesobacillus jeotgali TaxID=129985 RepID=UPI0009A7154B|nr:ribonuclease H-like domain-containing protein [Mesobacillus jeotgali]
MSLKNKLNRLKPHIKSGLEIKELVEVKNIIPESEPVNEKAEPEIPFFDVWEKEHVSPFYFDGQYCLVREVVYPLDHKHGHYQFSDLLKAVSMWNQEQTKHPLSAFGHSAADLVFFDTETTGLGGGAGNTIFLLGHASVSEDSVKLIQHILPSPGAEVALYQSFLENADYTTLVTYNGKAFDWPQVKTRHTLVRDHVPKLPSFGHFDLYHAARRMWKHKIERMKLSIVEQEVLGLERKDDIPGFLAPMIYFDFLERKDPEGLLGVIRHNETDILSLLTLYTHLTFQILGYDRFQTAQETYEVGRWFSYLGDTAKAKQAFTGIIDGKSEQEVSAKHALAFEHKKQQEWDDAALLWKESAEKGSIKQKKEACVELAKHFEHREKNFELALKYCRLAEEHIPGEKLATKKDMIFKQELEKRIQRISRKAFPGQAQNSAK